jgi:hypothetical protein
MTIVIMIFGVILFGLFVSTIYYRIKLLLIERTFQKVHPNVIGSDRGFKGTLIFSGFYQ